ncbi:hypothetical protein [Leifsonia sp. A12D58]|uniref:hypothetical protein n=1 Tax=Leifsonia sp. A12D58 TaxID=3397674 RepID=UPI0039E054F2
MTKNKPAKNKPAQNPHQFQPSKSDRLKPAELVGLSGVMGLFVGLVLLLVTRDVLFTLIGFGITFIVVLVVIAIFSLGMKPDEAEQSDLDEQNRNSKNH